MNIYKSYLHLQINTLIINNLTCKCKWIKKTKSLYKHFKMPYSMSLYIFFFFFLYI